MSVSVDILDEIDVLVEMCFLSRSLVFIVLDLVCLLSGDILARNIRMKALD
jgi:hypothetical protein